MTDRELLELAAFGVIVDRREEAGMTIRALPGVTLEDIK